MFKKINNRGKNIESYDAKVNDDFKKALYVNNVSELKPVGQVSGVPIIINNYLNKSVHAPIAMITNIDGHYYILVDSLFKELSTNGKTFALAHELGHKNLGHLENVDDKEGILVDIKLEYAADEYAAKIIGYTNAVKALDELLDVINTILPKNILGSIQYISFKHTLLKRKKHLMK